MENNDVLYEIKNLIEFFPEVEFPVILTSEYLEIFSKHNKPIPEKFINKFFNDINEPVINEMENEYIACFNMPVSQRYYAIVYIKIGLLTYEYYLQTFDKNGQSIAKKIIAKMTVMDNVFYENVAMINEDNIIMVMKGDKSKDEKFNPEKSEFLSYIIDDNGYISKYHL